MSRSRTPLQEGASKRLQRLHYLFSIIQLAMPEGIERPELLNKYAVATGLTLRKAEEHLDLLEGCGYLLWDDMRLYTTTEGIQWAGYRRDHRGELVDLSERTEEKRRERTHANTGKVQNSTTSAALKRQQEAQVTPTEGG